MYKNPYAKIKPTEHRPYTEVYLVRHCNPDYRLEKKLGERNMPLSGFGLEQRKHLTKKLMSLGPAKIYASGLVRAQETGALYTQKLRQDMVIDRRIDEIDWTHWHRIKYFNMSEETREKKLKSYKTLDKQLDKMQTAARRALADIVSRHPGKKIILFTHGNFIKSLVTSVLNADVIGFLSLEIFQSSITKLVVDRDGYVKISYINDASHLPVMPDKDLFITLKD
jgi:broad specificity phosphatase PhoE